MSESRKVSESRKIFERRKVFGSRKTFGRRKTRERRQKRRSANCLIWTLLPILALLLAAYFRQMYSVHERECFVPDYPRAVLSKDTDYETFFRQTGLGKSAVDKLLEEGDFERIPEIQEAFWRPMQVECVPILGWFTREERLVGMNVEDVTGEDAPGTNGKAGVSVGPDFVDLQPGDILLTLSTHSIGWRHGHVGLVIDEDTTLECVLLGTDSTYGDPQNWRKYSEYCVLRVKGVTAAQQRELVDYACSTLYGVPYHLTAGFLGVKAPEPDSSLFGLHCAYLVWYAWYQFGYDLDSDGGRLVSARDLLQSGQLEVVQMYGMNPETFILD